MWATIRQDAAACSTFQPGEQMPPVQLRRHDGPDPDTRGELCWVHRDSATLGGVIALPAFEIPVVDVGGLPLHPLVVHAAVVLIPLTAVGGFIMASSGARSKRYGPVIVAVAVVAAIAGFLAEASGITLRDELGMRTQQHFQYGEWLPWLSLALAAAVTLLFILDRQMGGKRNAMSLIVMIATVLIGVGSIVLTVLTGHSGAELVWG